MVAGPDTETLGHQPHTGIDRQHRRPAPHHQTGQNVRTSQLDGHWTGGGPDQKGGQFSTGDRGSVFSRWRHAEDLRERRTRRRWESLWESTADD